MVAFDRIFGDEEKIGISSILALPIIVLGNFFDTMIRNGSWRIMGNVKPETGNMPFPCYKILEEGKYYVETWDGKRKRPATSNETELLDRPNSNGAVFLEEA